MMSDHKKTTTQRKEDESLCPVCHDRMEIFAVGRCDHIICFRCAVRMRALCDQMYCAICRADLLQVLFIRRRRKFDSVDTSNFCIDRRYRMFSEDADIDKQWHHLLEHSCQLCPPVKRFETFPKLRDHMKREHTLFYCDLCIDNLKLFTADRKCYSRAELGRHRRLGDEDDKSYKGHPLCSFCDERYFDNDDLLRHCRKQHFYCHFCEADGITNEYFSEYPLLRDHFKTAHILCEEADCRHTEFTNAFRSDIDYRAHWAQAHSAGAGRQQARQMRQIDINVEFNRRDGDSGRRRGGPQYRGGGGGGGGRRVEPRDTGPRNSRAADTDGRQGPRERREVERKRREEIDEAHALSASLADVQKQGHISVIDPRLAQHPMVTSSTSVVSSSAGPSDTSAPTAKYQGRPEDFPTLDGTSDDPPSKSGIAESADVESAPQRAEEMSLAKKLAMSNRFSVSNGPMSMTDFPSLPGSAFVRTSKAIPVSEKEYPSRSVAPAGTKTLPMSEKDFPTLCSAATGNTKQRGKQTQAFAWNASEKSTTERAKPVNKAEGKSQWEFRGKSQEDFPSLPSAASFAELPIKAPSVQSSLAAISRNFSTGSLSKLANHADTTSDPSSLSWGPTLSHKSDKRQKGKDESKEKDGFLQLKAAKKSGKSASGADGNRKTSGFEVHENSFSALSETVASDSWTQGSTDEKKQESKPSKSSDTKTARAGSDPRSDKTSSRSKKKSDEANLQTKSSKTKTKKQKGAKTQGSGNQTTDESDVKGVPQQSSEPAVLGSSDPESIEIKSSVEESNGMDVKTDLPGSQEQSETHTVPCDAGSSDEPAVIRKDRDTTVENGNENNTGEGATSDPASDVDYTSGTVEPSETIVISSAAPVFSADDFPSLITHQSVAAPVPSAPPGFSSLPVSVARPSPPPGFGNSAKSCRPPPGLSALISTVVSDDDPLKIVTEESCDGSKSSTFIPPRDLQQRNASLVAFITGTVTNGNFGKFNELSGKFRDSDISAGEFHGGCREIMESEAFLSIFPELIALLPDLPKQNQLLKVHREFLSKTRPAGKARSWCAGPEDGLVSCVVCGQVVRHSDQYDHSAAHSGFNTDYPTLSDTSLCSVR